MKSPAFQWYPNEWLSSRPVRYLMDAEQRGWYFQLLNESWMSKPQCSLPNDPKLLWQLAGAKDEQTFNERSTVVISQFKLRQGLLWNERLLEELAKQKLRREQTSKAGQKSAKSKREYLESIKDEHVANERPLNERSDLVEQNGQPAVEQNINPSSSSSSSSSNKKARGFDVSKLDIPSALDTPLFREKWRQWVAYRMRYKKVKEPEQMFELQLREMASWGLDAAMEAMGKSMANEWQGLHQPTVKTVHKAVSMTKPMSSDEILKDVQKA